MFRSEDKYPFAAKGKGDHPFVANALELKWRRKYLAQGKAACERGILFRITFEEWFKLWKDSGQLHNRGTKRGQYVMGRFNDKGPYAIGNVEIITCSQNTSDNFRGKERSKEHRLKISRGLKAAWRSGKRKSRMSA